MDDKSLQEEFAALQEAAAEEYLGLCAEIDRLRGLVQAFGVRMVHMADMNARLLEVKFND